MEMSFLELRCKEVVNVVDGKRLGHVVDLCFNLQNGCLLGIVVPGEKNFWSVFKSSMELFIPLQQIVKVGEDTILVEVYSLTGKQTPYIMDTKKKDKH